MSGQKKKQVDDLVWEDPPMRHNYDWRAIADRLRENPMSWAVIFRQDRTSLVTALRQGSINALHPDLGFEIRTSNNVKEPRTCTLHMRFNPDKVDGLRDALRKDK